MQLTMEEVKRDYGGLLPPGATFKPDPPPPRPGDAARETKPKRRTRSERFAALNAFVDMGMADLTGAEVKTWLVLFRDTKGNGLARTSQADIARRAGLSRRAVQVALNSLTTKGRVQIVRRGRLSAGPSSYRVNPIAAG